jgi:hypothetical protein
MPYICFSYSADVPPSARNRAAGQAALRDLRRMPHSCFTYPVYACFSYPADVPPGTRNRDIMPPALPGLRRMPVLPCFSY